MAKRRKRQADYDKPRDGYKRWTTFVRTDLLKAFKEVAASEGKPLLVAVEEALENWTNYEDET